MSTNTINPGRVTTGVVRFSYAHVFVPQGVDDSDDKKYSVNIIIPKSDKKTIKAIEEAIEFATEAGKASKFGGKIPPKLDTPLRDGDVDRPEDETYADAYFINAKSKTKPGIIDTFRNELTDDDSFYSGCYGRVSITFYAYNVSGNKGIAAGLNNILKTKDGERLGGRNAAAKDFEDFLDDDEDSLL